MISNMADLAEMLAAEPNEASIKRNVYKYTDCGAWIELKEDGIRLGSIVEGCDSDTATYALKYPFTEEDYRARVNAIEKEADALWKWSNEGPEGSEETWASLGLDAPDVCRDYENLSPDDPY